LTNGKVNSYIGFAKKSGNLKCGINAIATLKKAELLIICNTATANSFSETDKLISKFKCRAFISVTDKVENLSGKENCKLIAVTDKKLAEAIINNSGSDFKEYFGGHKV